MDLDELRAFVTVAREGSFLAASAALGVPRTSLRRRVEALEARLGVPLLERERTKVQLTEAGHALLDEGSRLLDHSRAAMTVAREAGRRPRGPVAVALPTGVAPQAMAPLFSLLHERYPDLRLHVKIHDDPVSLLLRGADVALDFGFTDPAGPFQSRVMMSLREWVVASPEYLARMGTPERPEDLQAHTLLAWEGPRTDPRRWPLLGGGHIAVDPALIASDIHLLRSLARAGQGIAFVPDALLPEDASVPGTELVAVLEHVVLRERQVRLVIPSALQRVPAVQALETLAGELLAVVSQMQRAHAG